MSTTIFVGLTLYPIRLYSLPRGHDLTRVEDFLELDQLIPEKVNENIIVLAHPWGRG